MAFTRMRYHIVTATKGRLPTITEEIERTVYDAILDRAEALGCRVIAIGGVADHVHLVSAIPAALSVSTVIGRIKGASSRKVHQQFPHHDDFRWQVGFGAFTVSPGQVGKVAAYVRNQKIRHEFDHLWDVFERVE